MTRLRIAVAGASGKMGRTVVRAIAESQDSTLAAAFVRAAHEDIGADAGVVAGARPLSIALTEASAPGLAGAHAVVDFTIPAASLALLGLSANAHVAHVIGTTGFSSEQEEQIAAFARETVVIKSGNMSLGVTLLAALLKQAARALPDFDIEILEMHHRAKVDAPSGTALLLGAAAADGRNVSLPDNSITARDRRRGPRKEGVIGFASLRGGTVIGEHEVILAGPQERVILSHVAEDRMIFARGALAAAHWAQGRPNGLYSMAAVLGLAA